MNIINQVTADLLGSYSAAFYITYSIFVLFGILISLRLQAFGRDKSSPNTPYRFSFSFLVQDNLLRIVSSLAIVFVAIRFGSELFKVEPTYLGALLMGISFDQILIQLQKLELRARK